MAELLILALVIFGYAQVSERLAMAPITAPMVFTAAGLFFGVAVLGWFDLDLDSEAVSILIEATLVLVLFTDAIRIDLRALRKDAQLPMRLLGIGLPLSLVLGTVAALILLPGLSFFEAALLAAVLAPTDAALGQAVVSDKRLPVRLRQGLNIESGLNDGIVLPVVTVLLALASAESDAGGLEEWGPFVARQIGFGVLCGLIAGGLGGALLHQRAVADKIEGIYQQLGTIAIAVAAFASAEQFGGNGFIAAFVAGLAFGYVAQERCAHVQDFTEDEGELLTVITFTIFGAALAGPLFLDPLRSEMSWRVVGYVLLSLTVVRMGPALLALWRSGTLVETRLFAAWFGPRGLASILFALIVLEELGPTGGAADEIFLVATWTILASVFLHGATASPWSARLARRIEAGPEHMAEMEPVRDLPTRRRLG